MEAQNHGKGILFVKNQGEIKFFLTILSFLGVRWLYQIESTKRFELSDEKGGSCGRGFSFDQENEAG